MTKKFFTRAVLILAAISLVMTSGSDFRSEAAGRKRRKAPAKTVSRARNDRKLDRITTEAKNGNVSSQFELARMYYTGDGVKQDYTQAFKWYSQAADHGDANAQYRVAEMYYLGRGVRQNFTNAAKFFRKACITSHHDDRTSGSAFQKASSSYKSGNYRLAAEQFRAAWSRPVVKRQNQKPEVKPEAPKPAPKVEEKREPPKPEPKHVPESKPEVKPEAPKPAPKPIKREPRHDDNKPQPPEGRNE